MKNLKLKFSGAEILSREDLKKVLGGANAPGGDTCDCNSKDDCKDAAKPTCYNCGSNGENGKKWGYCDK